MGGGAQNFSKTLSVDPRSGSAAVAIPLYIPQGRGGISPALGLSYAPTNGNGPFGWGMSMDMGSVVRSTKNGVPNYDSTDTFLVSLAGKDFELVSLGSNNEYRSKYDDDRVRFFFNSNVWSAKDKSGTTYYFGSRTGSTVTDGATKVFKWKLDRIEDLFGNVLVVDYGADNGFEVRYGLMVGKSTTLDVNTPANFAYVIDAVAQTSDRPDVFTDYKPGFAVNEKRLISTLTITGGGNLIKKYNFTYAPSVKTGHSLLKNVTEVGADGTTAQPVVNLQYNDTTPAAYSIFSITDPVTGNDLWNCHFSGGYDHGSNNYGPVAPPSFGVTWGPTYTQASGSWSNGSWSMNSLGNLSFSATQDTANACWTYVYVNAAKTISVPWAADVGGAYLNGSYSASLGQSWALQKGYNLVEVTGYNQNQSMSFQLHTDIANQVDLMNASQVIYPQLSADFNGDGMSDVATYYAQTGTLKVALSNGTIFLPKATWIDGFGIGKQLILGDFNGDGRTDIAAYDPSAGTIQVALSDGTKFVNGGTWLSGVSASANVLTGDFNGDGLTDLYIMTQDSSGWKLQVAKSSGTAFTMGSIYHPHVGSLTAAIIPMDVNGDGVTDLAGFDKSTGTWSIHLNTNGFNETNFYSTTGFGTNMLPVTADFNQDGQTDIGYFDAANKKVVYLPTVAGGFGAQQTLTFNFTLTDPLMTQIQAADYNGDGIMDFMVFDSLGHSDLAISGGTKFQDLVTGYDNGVGASVSMSYMSSSQVTNIYLPFLIPVVQSATASNNLGDSFATTYVYSGGYWNPAEREMYGFKEAAVIDPDGNYTRSQFNQDNLYMRGHLDRVAVYGADGKIYQETRYLWSNDPVIAGRTDVRFVSPLRVDSFVYDTASATPTGVRTATETAYDIPLGVPTQIRDYGEVDWTTGADTGTDYIRTDLTYGSNAASYIYGLVTSKISYDMSNNILAKSYAYYDGSTTTGAVTLGLLTRSDVWNKIGATESLVSTINTYNTYGQLLTTKDPLNNTTSITYDTVWSMFPMTTTDAKGFVRSSAYYGVNNVPLTGGIWGLAKSATDINNQILSTTYDPLGRVSTVINPLDTATYPTTTYEYQTRTNYRVLVTHKRVEHGQAATLDAYAYIDGFGRGIASKMPTDTAGTYVVSGQATLNNRGLVIKEYPPYFSTSGYDVLELPLITQPGISYAYDMLGRRTQTTFADTTYASFSFTPTTATVIDPNGHKTVQVRDARGRMTRVEEWNGADGRSSVYPAQAFALYAATTYAYDILGNLLSVTDAKGNVTAMTYDALGRKLTMNDPDMHNVSYQYDALGQLTRQTDAKSVPFAFTYDVLGRVLTKARADNGADSVSYTYEMASNYTTHYGNGRLAQVSYTSGGALFDYDPIGQETGAGKLIGSNLYVFWRTYDALGRLKTLQYPDGNTAYYNYNASGRLNDITSLITKISYTANGSIHQITYANGAVAAYVYDPLTFRLQTQVVTDKNSVAVQYNAYTYDPVGNILQVQDNVKNTSKTYTYDALGRMVSSNDGTGAISYQYDQIGNITNKGNLSYTYAQNGAGPHAVTAVSDGSAMTYDNNGNMATYQTTAKTQYYTYDTTNRLTKVEAKDAGTTTKYTVVDYTYDGDGGRTTKVLYVRNGSTTTLVGTNYVGDVYEESNGVRTDFIYMGNMRIAAFDGTHARWFIGDHLGSTSTVLDETSAVKEKIEYTPWGEVKSYENFGNTSEVAWLYFTGKKLDVETGLVYFGARFYNPKLGRFITPDTIVQSPYNPQTLNRYTYCNNNPVNLVDPTGHSWFKKVFGGGSGTAAAIIGAVVGIVATVCLGPGGALAWYGWATAGAVGGALGGAVSGALTGGWQGALTGAAIGGVLGGVGGYYFGGSGSAGSGGTRLASVTRTVTVTFDWGGGSALGDAIANASASGLGAVGGGMAGAIGGAAGAFAGAFSATASAIGTNVVDPAINTLTRPGWNAGTFWAHAEQGRLSFADGVGLGMDAAWAIGGAAGAVEAGVGAFSGRVSTFYQYYGPASNPGSMWVARAQYSLDVAMERLSAPTTWTSMREVNVPWYKYVGGPRPVLPQFGRAGGGLEYKIGGFGDWGQYISDAFKSIVYGYK